MILIIFIIILILASELSCNLVYGRLLFPFSEEYKELEKSVLLLKDNLGDVNSKDILRLGNWPFGDTIVMAKSAQRIFASYYILRINDYHPNRAGRIPRFTKLHNLLKELHKQALNKQ